MKSFTVEYWMDDEMPVFAGQDLKKSISFASLTRNGAGEEPEEN